MGCAASRPVAQERREDFAELLFNKNLYLVSTVLQLPDIDEPAIQLVLRLFSAPEHPHVLYLFEHLVTMEVEASQEANTMFRSNTGLTKLFNAMTASLGNSYLRSTLHAPLQQVLTGGESYEVDPKKSSGTEDVTVNAQLLRLNCQYFLDCISNSAGSAPASFRQLMNVIRNVADKRFPGHGIASVGTFLMLRYFCPAIVNPDGAGLLEQGKVLSKRDRRNLLLVSKVTQKCASHATFGDNDPHMKQFNEYLAESSAQIDAYLSTLSSDDTVSSIEQSKKSKDRKKKKKNQSQINKIDDNMQDNDTLMLPKIENQVASDLDHLYRFLYKRRKAFLKRLGEPSNSALLLRGQQTKTMVSELFKLHRDAKF